MPTKKLSLQPAKSVFNPVIRLLTLCDIFVWGTALIASPLVAIYLISKFGTATVGYVGIGTAVYYLIRGIFQVPVGALTDKIKSDRDEIALLIFGCVFMAIPYFFIPVISQPWHYFVLMGLGGLGASLNLNSWRKLFAQNLEKGHAGFTYGAYETMMSLSTAIFGVVGGYLSEINTAIFGTVIISVGGFILTGGVVAALLYLVNERKSA